jgi:hypothetical protein
LQKATIHSFEVIRLLPVFGNTENSFANQYGSDYKTSEVRDLNAAKGDFMVLNK